MLFNIKVCNSLLCAHSGRDLLPTMDTREDIPRISIENAQNWQRLESGYKKAVLQRFEEDLNNSGLANERDALQVHILRVGLPFFSAYASSHLPQVH